MPIQPVLRRAYLDGKVLVAWPFLLRGEGARGGTPLGRCYRWCDPMPRLVAGRRPLNRSLHPPREITPDKILQFEDVLPVLGGERASHLRRRLRPGKVSLFEPGVAGVEFCRGNG